MTKHDMIKLHIFVCTCKYDLSVSVMQTYREKNAEMQREKCMVNIS